MRFFDDGQVNFPWLSDGIWFLTQQRRWGLLTSHPDYRAVARQVNRIDLYREAAEQVGVSVPGTETRASTLMDGRVRDGADPFAYAEGFEISGGGFREAA